MNIKKQVHKQALGCVVVGVYANQLHVNEEMTLFSSEFVLKVRNPESLRTWYLRIGWFEDENSEDHLIINEQDTPDPLEYIKEPVLSKEEYIVIGSLFNFNDNLINKVYGYGYKNKTDEILTTLLFEFEESYLLINTGSLIEIRYLTDKPSVPRDVIFSLE
ncbi:hypothetical protein M3649_08060 [Ureibacillus chungkukjangi]|uniref:hypothetical protein n=1 Tax=Ureibacillus chungkukjangi TaxID=1202712 RepID=UPI00203BDFF6|nr:hypothetical protein [Ureibacillus chungkukjangi]MCM3388089.1 hypothetical protein [Ureibacillus chungkukjangi]